MAVKRMDNMGIVVEDLDAAVEFFKELGLDLEGRMPIEGEWAEGVTGLRGMKVEIAMMRTPDGHSRLELSRFLSPAVEADSRRAPVKASIPAPPTSPALGSLVTPYQGTKSGPWQPSTAGTQPSRSRKSRR